MLYLDKLFFDGAKINNVHSGLINFSKKNMMDLGKTDLLVCFMFNKFINLKKNLRV